MTTQTLAETMSSNASASSQRRDDAIAAGDVEILIRDCMEAVAKLLKDSDDKRAGDVLWHLENTMGIAGAMKLECE